MENKFAERLNEILKNNEITQTELARRLKVTHTCVNFWLKGKREPCIDMILEICKAVDESSDYLLGLTD